jgi:hypothetical protein
MQSSDSSDAGADWGTLARESFEYSVIPWAGRPYASWIRAWSRPDTRDPNGLMQLPPQIYDAFQKRGSGQRLSRKEAERLGYPRVPGEQELARVRQELHEALLRCDWDHAHDLDAQLRDLQERVAETRMAVLRSRPALGT